MLTLVRTFASRILSVSLPMVELDTRRSRPYFALEGLSFDHCPGNLESASHMRGALRNLCIFDHCAVGSLQGPLVVWYNIIAEYDSRVETKINIINEIVYRQ